MTKIVFIAKKVSNPTTRYRVAPLMDALQSSGVQVSHFTSDAGVIAKIKLLRLAASADVLVIQRKLYSSFYLHLLRKCCNKIVFDFDDAIFLNSDGTANTKRWLRFQNISKFAWQVWAGNQYLLKAAGRLDGHQFVPTCIDLKQYPAPETLSEEEADADGDIKMVWVGSRSTKKYLEIYRDRLEQLGKQFKNLRLVIVSDFEFELKHLAVDCIAWSKDAEQTALRIADIGIAPMSDDGWTRGKCALKVLQYMAAGLPVITDKVGANAEVVRHGETGFVVTSDADWITAVAKLIDSPALAQSMGKQGRLRVEQAYNIDLWCEKQRQWLQI